MGTVALALRQHADAYLQQFASAMPVEHKRVLAFITRCRTGELGHLHYQCDSCSRRHWVGRSCGNRHCPNCQQEKTQVWLQARMRELLPTHYFMVTFTVPGSLRRCVRSNQRTCYGALFDAASATLVELASDKRFVGTDRMGYFGALHTWRRDFTVYNPHVHFVVPGGGVSADGSKWMASPENFLLVEKAASSVFAGKFRTEMEKAGLDHEFKAVDAKAWFGSWNVDVIAVGDGKSTLKYLAPYVYRVAISDNRILDVTDSHVKYRFTPSGTKRSVTREVTGQEFVRGFLQHVLPKGFQRIRYYGFLSPNSKLTVGWVKMLVWFYRGWCYWLAKQATEPEPTKRPVICNECGGEMKLVAITSGSGAVVWPKTLVEHSIAYLDSG